MNKIEKQFQYNYIVKYSDVDSYKIMHHPKYITYSIDSLYFFIQKLTKDNFIYNVRKINIKHIKSLRLYDKMIICIRMYTVKNNSLLAKIDICDSNYRLCSSITISGMIEDEDVDGKEK